MFGSYHKGSFASDLAFLLLLLGLPLRVFAAPTFAGPVTNGTVNVPNLTEVSGVAASRNNPGVLWVHNDAGNAPVVYALDAQGQSLGTYALPDNVDNEDIGMGPGPVTNVSYMYVMDIGDNTSVRANIAVYQIPEPAVYAWQAGSPVVNHALKGVRTITLTYPDGARNAEAAFVDPVTGDLFILSKASTSRIYTAPKAWLDSSTNITLTYLHKLNFDVPSGADISPLGNEIVVRQEDFAGLWPRTNGQTVGDALLGVSNSIPVVGTGNGEPNGEAIGFDSYGGGYFTLSDSSDTQPLRYFARTSHDGPTPPRVLLPMAASWKFLDTGLDQGTAWQAPEFDDSLWKNGLAQIGYGDGDESTLASFGANPAAKPITTYFRKTFAVTNAGQLAALTLKLVVDDGANVYLNGTLVAGVNLADDATATTPATPMPDALRDTWHSYAVDPRLLHEGNNTLAVEVHLAAANAASMSFDLQLLGTEAPRVTAVSWAPARAEVFLTGSGNAPTTVQGTADFLNWTTLGNVVLTNGSGVFDDGAAPNFNLRLYRAFRALP
ncbi:MAG TPA: hypothetical protein VL527_15840 [Dongiaceae bacterium]|nr:hypothetical protein [Dongiaceae bacterium]